VITDTSDTGFGPQWKGKSQLCLLAMETSGKSGSVSVLRANPQSAVCNSEDLSPQWGSAKTLAPTIQRLLKDLSIEPTSLDAIALVTGPGSFTGLRVGVATAKAMAYALQVPVIEVDTLDAIAFQNVQVPQVMHIIMDAYRGQLFYASYVVKREGTFEKLTETKIVDMTELVGSILDSNPSTERILFFGPGCSRFQKTLQDDDWLEGRDLSSIRSRFIWDETPKSIPQAESVARLGLQRFIRNQTLDPMSVMPHYYRASAAEESAAT
jgi:tRNA threonylcarbamoyladenosine biosynthesis protein TsaB